MRRNQIFCSSHNWCLIQVKKNIISHEENWDRIINLKLFWFCFWKRVWTHITPASLMVSHKQWSVSRKSPVALLSTESFIFSPRLGWSEAISSWCDRVNLKQIAVAIIFPWHEVLQRREKKYCCMTKVAWPVIFYNALRSVRFSAIPILSIYLFICLFIYFFTPRIMWEKPSLSAFWF